MLEIEKARCGYKNYRIPEKVILEDISFSVERGEVLCILGANGAGKTTLFKSILGTIPLLAGSVKIDGMNRNSMSKMEIARKIGYVPQSHITSFPYSVLQIVVMGRTSHLSDFQSPGKKDLEIARTALERMGIEHLADEIYTEISGGERQLALIARALAQEADLLLMDEPTSNLDLGNQVRVLGQMKELSKQGVGVVFTTHYPNHAFLCADKAAVIKRRSDFSLGLVDEIITQEILEEIYGVEVSVISSTSRSGTAVKNVLTYI